MRLLIAGILSLVIYLMTCGYKNEAKTEKEMEKMNKHEQHFENKTSPFYPFIFPLDPFERKFQPPYIFKEPSNNIDTQTFSNV